MFIDYRLFYVDIILGEGTKLRLKCSAKLLPHSLKKLAEMFNVTRKLTFPYEILQDRALFLNNTFSAAYRDVSIKFGHRPKTLLLRYARADCQALLEVLTNF